MAENQAQKKKEAKKAEVVWISESARIQAEALMAHKSEWEQANKARELEAIIVTLANMYPQDRTNILHLMQGNVALETPKIRKVMKDVPEDNVQRVVETGCDDCGDNGTRQLRFSDLKTEQDIITYFGADKDETEGLRKMNIMLMENEISESKSVATAAKSLLAMKNKGGYLV